MVSLVDHQSGTFLLEHVEEMLNEIEWADVVLARVRPFCVQSDTHPGKARDETRDQSAPQLAPCWQTKPFI